MPYAQVFQVLRDVEPLEGAALPPAALGRLRSALDVLRDQCAPGAHVDLAERIAVAAHRLDLAVRSRDDGQEAAARAELLLLFEAWLELEVPVS